MRRVASAEFMVASVERVWAVSSLLFSSGLLLKLRPRSFLKHPFCKARMRKHMLTTIVSVFHDAVSLSPRLPLYLQRPFSQKWAGEGLRSASCSLLHVEQRESCKRDFNLFNVLDGYACWVLLKCTDLLAYLLLFFYF